MLPLSACIATCYFDYFMASLQTSMASNKGPAWLDIKISWLIYEESWIDNRQASMKLIIKSTNFTCFAIFVIMIRIIYICYSKHVMNLQDVLDTFNYLVNKWKKVKNGLIA